MDQPHLVLLYHFFHPDEVISARLFSDLASHMAAANWRVTAMPAARLFQSGQELPKSEDWSGVVIQRIKRPAFAQASNRGRILNAILMLCAWSWRALVLKRNRREVVVIGTDPVLSILVAIGWRIFRPGARIIHWCHDLHPEASIAEGSLRASSLGVRLLRWLLRRAYRRCDAIVDLGSCMRQLLQDDVGAMSGQQPIFTTITPWALVEPATVSQPHPQVREELFGHCQLGCLYSGNLGRAHEFDLFVELARRTADDGVRFCFAGRGARLDELKQLVAQQPAPIQFAGFANESQLNLRLAAGDVHLVSLKDEWTGTVVPSKFFGALAIGRPILFLGAAHCALARWIEEHRVGWHLTAANLEQVAAELRELAQNRQKLQALNAHCQNVYHRCFSKQQQLNGWHALFASLDPV